MKGDEDLMVIAIYRDDEHGCTSLEVVGGPKRYLRIWDGLDRIEWGWKLNEASRQVYGEEIEAVTA